MGALLAPSEGVTSAIVFANLGAAYGTAKSGVGISTMGVMRPDLVMRSIIPVVMAGVLGIYGLITAVIINGKLDPPVAAWTASIWTFACFLRSAHESSKSEGGGLIIMQDRFWAGLLAGCAVFMLYYFF